MAISLGVVEKEYNQLFKERETLTRKASSSRKTSAFKAGSRSDM